MQLWLTLLAGDGSTSTPTSLRPVELWVQAPPAATVAELRTALATAGLVGPGSRCPADDLYAGGRRLDDADRLGRPPLLEGAVIHVGRPSTPPVPRGAGFLSLAITGGPDCGLTIPLGAGRHTAGRGIPADIRIDDPDLSRCHLELAIDDGPALVRDLRSTNGSRLGTRPLPLVPTPWSMAERVHAGNTTFELRTAGSRSAAARPDDEGHLLVNRPPRRLPAARDIEVRLPPQPEPRPRVRVPLLTTLVPLALAVVMARLQHSASYLLFGVMSPAMMVGSLVSERRGGRRDARRRQAEWQAASHRAETQLAQALREEATARRATLPDAAALLQTALTPLDRLWERRPADPDFLRLRLGLGRLTADVRVVGPDLAARPTPVDDVPVSVSLQEVGVLGVAGGRPASLALTRHLVGQVAGWHSPSDVTLVLLSARAGGLGDWQWAARLPHTRPVDPTSARAWVGGPRAEQLRQRLAELTELVDARIRARDRPAPGPAPRDPMVVVVLDEARALRELPGMRRVLSEGPGVGVVAICLADRRELLPVECVAVVEFPDVATSTATSTAVCGVPGLTADTSASLRLDGVSADWAERLGRALAPLRDATPAQTGAEPPEGARLVDLLDLDATSPAALADRWRTTPRSTLAVLGVTADSTYSVDLRHDGPHLLVGGTTGSGKSELLQTLIASLAVVNSPEHLGLVLVDYKGGSAFDACADLPHTLGLVTDLDPHLTERALISLRAELTRREALLRRAGATDLDDYHRRVGAAGPGLPRLVLVIDEFRMLAEELPDFLAGVVRIGAVGRSLGVHLVLATQRPAGVVSADIAANVNLRIALRVRDQADSEDVIEARDAAAISPRLPGRAFARSAANPLVLFQTARVAAAFGADPPPLLVEAMSLQHLGEPIQPPKAPPASGAPNTDLQAIVRAAREAATDLALPPVRRPWLPPLPDVIRLDDLAAAPDGYRCPYGALDRPDRQSQETVAWDLVEDTHLLVVGTLRSGRSTFLRTLAGSLARSFGPHQVHVHAVDGGAGSLRALTVLPHTGVVAASDDGPRGVLLLDRLAAEVAARQSRLSADGFTTLAEQHAHVAVADRLPYLVLLLDGWESLAASWEQVEHGRPIETVLALLRDGTAVGLRVAVTGDRALLTSRLASLVRDKVVLRLADPSDLVLCGVPVTAVPQHLPPGRGVRVSDHCEVQLAVLGNDTSGPGQASALDQIAAQAISRSSVEPALPLPLRIETLPRCIDFTEAASRAPLETPGWALVGVGGDSCAAVGLVLPGCALVAGPPRSGRSTALATIARWLSTTSRPVVAVATDRTPLTVTASRTGGAIVTRHDAPRLRALLDEQPDACLLVDDVELLMDSELEDVALQWFKGLGAGLGSLVVAGASAELSLAFRGLSVIARRSGQGVLLSPATYADGDLLGVRVPPVAGPPPPGRGVLVQAGRVTPIQVAR